MADNERVARISEEVFWMMEMMCKKSSISEETAGRLALDLINQYGIKKAKEIVESIEFEEIKKHRMSRLPPGWT